MSGTRPRRSGRLSRSADFDRVMRSGRSQGGKDFVLYTFPRGGEEPPRMGMSVSRKVGGAVERNKVKRLLREAFAAEAWRLAPGTDAVVIARPGARVLAERDGLRGIQEALGELLARTATGASAGKRRDAGKGAGAAASATAVAQPEAVAPVGVAAQPDEVAR